MSGKFIIATELRGQGSNTIPRICGVNPGSIIYFHESTQHDAIAVDVCLENGDWVTLQGSIADFEKALAKATK